jgi:hypothetical protein
MRRPCSITHAAERSSSLPDSSPGTIVARASGRSSSAEPSSTISPKSAPCRAKPRSSSESAIVVISASLGIALHRWAFKTVSTNIITRQKVKPSNTHQLQASITPGPNASKQAVGATSPGRAAGISTRSKKKSSSCTTFPAQPHAGTTAEQNKAPIHAPCNRRRAEDGRQRRCKEQQPQRHQQGREEGKKRKKERKKTKKKKKRERGASKQRESFFFPIIFH